MAKDYRAGSKANTKTPKTPAIPKQKKTIIIQDPLARGVAITAILEQNGLRVKTESRAAAAFDRLLGNILDTLGSRFEPNLDRRRDENNLTRELRQIDADAALEKARARSEAGDIYLERYRLEQMTKDTNMIKVSLAAIDDLKREPEPKAVDGVAAIQLDPDWLNGFADIAAHKSNDDIQNLWGRLLAGEIRQPGTFKLRTLQRLSAIDSLDSIKIHSFLTMAISNAYVFRDDRFVNFNDVLEMEDLGVVNSGGGNLTTNWNADDSFPQLLVFSDRALIAISNSKRRVTLNVYTLTAFGRALSSLISFAKIPDEYFNAIALKLIAQGQKIKWTSISPEKAKLNESDFIEWSQPGNTSSSASSIRRNEKTF